MFQPQSLNIGTQMKFKMAQMYQNQLSWQNQLKCIKISSVVKTALLSRIQGTDGSIFHPDVQKNETLFLFNKVYISLIRLYFKNFSPRICANLFPWSTRRRRFTTASQPIGKLINHVQNLSFYFGFPLFIPHLVLVLTVQGGANFNGRPCLILRFLILSRSRHFTVSPSHCTNILWPLHSLMFQSLISQLEWSELRLTLNIRKHVIVDSQVCSPGQRFRHS